MHLIRMSEFVDLSARETLINLDAIRKVQAKKSGNQVVLDIWFDNANGSPTSFFPINSGGDDYAAASPKDALKSFLDAIAAYQR